MDHRSSLVAYLSTVDPTGRDPVSGDRIELDSLGLLQVVNYLEETYGMKLSDLALEPDDLRTVSGILSLIDRHAATRP